MEDTYTALQKEDTYSCKTIGCRTFNNAKCRVQFLARSVRKEK